MESKDSFIKSQLRNDESILYSVKPSWNVVYMWIAIFIAGFMFWPIINGFLAFYLAVAIFVSFWFIVGLSLYVHGSEFAVTNKRVIGKVGVISRSTFEISLQQSEGLVVNQGLTGRILGFGSILKTGTGGAKSGIHFIPSPWDVRIKINESIESVE